MNSPRPPRPAFAQIRPKSPPPARPHQQMIRRLPVYLHALFAGQARRVHEGADRFEPAGGGGRQTLGPAQNADQAEERANISGKTE